MFEASTGYPPSVYLRHPETTLDQPFNGLWLETPHVAIGTVLLGPLREETKA